jgi:hypothetical protein
MKNTPLQRLLSFSLQPASCILTAAIIFKVILLALNSVPFNGDEGVIALMARHILQGERPLFFYGQAYLGSTDAWLVAFSFSIFGQSVLAIRLVQVALFAATLITTYFVARRFGLDKWSAAIAMLLLALPPTMLTLYTTATLGGYGETLLLGNVLMLMADSRWLTPALHATRQRGASVADNQRSIVNCHQLSAVRFLLLGSVAGFGFYTFPLFLIYLMPVGVWLLFQRSWSAWRGYAIGLIGFLIGSAAWWMALIQSGGVLINEMIGSAMAGSVGGSYLNSIGVRLIDFFVFGASALFGIRYPWAVYNLMPILSSAGLMIVIGLPLYFVMRRMTGRVKISVRLFEFVVISLAVLIGLFYFPAVPQLATPALGAVTLFVYSGALVYAIKCGSKILWGMIGVLFVTFLITPFGGDPSGRYFLPLYLPLAIFTASLLSRLREKNRTLVGLLIAVILGYNVISTLNAAAIQPPGISTQFDPVSWIDHTRDQELIDFLLAHGETRGYSNYWVEYPIAFLSNERIIASAQLPYHLDRGYTPRDDRYLPYTEVVAQAPRAFYITTNHPNLDELIRSGLTRLNVTFNEHATGNYHIFYDLSRKVTPDELQIIK